MKLKNLRYNLKAIASASSANNNSLNLSSSAESFISDMMKEAMSSNPMLQSVYGSLDSPTQPTTIDPSSPSYVLKNKQTHLLGRKRNTSLTQQSPDLQTKRMLSHQLISDLKPTLDVLVDSGTTDKTLLREKCLNDVTTTSALLKESISEEKLGLITKPTLYVDDEKENCESNWSRKPDDDDDDENLINLIDSNINMGNFGALELNSLSNCGSLDTRSKKLTDSQSSEVGGLGLNIPVTTIASPKTTAKPSDRLDYDEFHFDLPFNDLSSMSPLSFQPKQGLAPSSSSTAISYSSLLAAELKSIPSSNSMSQSTQRQLKFGSSNPSNSPSGRRRLYFKPKNSSGGDGNRSDSDSNGREHGSDSDSSDDDTELLKDFDIIDVIPGLGEPPKNNQDFEIKYLRNDTKDGSNAKSMMYSKYLTSTSPGYQVEIKDDHFRKPLTKIDVLKAPDNYPVPMNVFCVQEISINWFLYGGHDFDSTEPSSVVLGAESSQTDGIRSMLKILNSYSFN